MMWGYHILFIDSPIDECFGYLHFWATMNSVTRSIHVQPPEWTVFSVLLGRSLGVEVVGHTPRSRSTVKQLWGFTEGCSFSLLGPFPCSSCAHP